MRSRRRDKRAGDLVFDEKLGTWRSAGMNPPLHLQVLEARRRALDDGFHAGFIMGFEVASVFGMVIGVIVLGT